MKRINIFSGHTYRAAAVVILTVSLFLSGCSNSVMSKDPFALYIHLGAEPDTLNLITSTDAYATTINSHIYESLLDRNKDTLELFPQLAERYTISPDKLKFRFYLKKGVLWSDGIEFTADDILYSYKIMKDPKVASSHLKVYYIDVKNLRKIDRYTVEFECTRQYYLALEMCGSIPIVPKHIFDDGTDFNNHKNSRFPIGTGPYKLSRWLTGDRIELVFNEKFRGRVPDIKKIVYKVVEEGHVALQMLMKGGLDVMQLSSIQWMRQTNSKKFNQKFFKLKYFLPQYSYIGWNARKPYFQDRRVRLALTHLINREKIMEKLSFGLGKVVNGTFYILSKSYNNEFPPWPYDPAKGKLLLKQAGWIQSQKDGFLYKDGKKFTFVFSISSGSDTAEKLATILKEDFSKVGIDMLITKFEWAVFVQNLHKRDFEAVMLAWSLGYNDDPYQLWHSSQIPQGSNYCSFNSPESDRLIETARKEFDAEKRYKLYRRMGVILHEEQPYTFMFTNPALVVVSRRFENVKVHTAGLEYLEWKVEKHK